MDLERGGGDLPAIVSGAPFAVVPPSAGDGEIVPDPGSFVGSGGYVLSRTSSRRVRPRGQPALLGGQARDRDRQHAHGPRRPEPGRRVHGGDVDVTPDLAHSTRAGSPTTACSGRRCGATRRCRSPTTASTPAAPRSTTSSSARRSPRRWTGGAWPSSTSPASSVAATGMVPAGMPGRRRATSCRRTTRRQPRQLLAEAGYPGGAGSGPSRSSPTAAATTARSSRCSRRTWASRSTTRPWTSATYQERLATDPPGIWSLLLGRRLPGPERLPGRPAGDRLHRQPGRLVERRLRCRRRRRRRRGEPRPMRRRPTRGRSASSGTRSRSCRCRTAPRARSSATACSAPARTGTGILRLAGLVLGEDAVSAASPASPASARRAPSPGRDRGCRDPAALVAPAAPRGGLDVRHAPRDGRLRQVDRRSPSRSARRSSRNASRSGCSSRAPSGPRSSTCRFRPPPEPRGEVHPRPRRRAPGAEHEVQRDLGRRVAGTVSSPSLSAPEADRLPGHVARVEDADGTRVPCTGTRATRRSRNARSTSRSEAIADTSALLGVTESEPVDFFIYADDPAFKTALRSRHPRERRGQARADIRTLFALITPTTINDPRIGDRGPPRARHTSSSTPPSTTRSVHRRVAQRGARRRTCRRATRPRSGARREPGVDPETWSRSTRLSGQFPTDGTKTLSRVRDRVSAIDYLVRTFGQDALVLLVARLHGRPDRRRGVHESARHEPRAFQDAWLADLGAGAAEAVRTEPGAARARPVRLDRDRSAAGPGPPPTTRPGTTPAAPAGPPTAAAPAVPAARRRGRPGRRRLRRTRPGRRPGRHRGGHDRARPRPAAPRPGVIP